jgi:L-ascorbate metabolism protein UlaG (beta-lactamase superfamily)
MAEFRWLGHNCFRIRAREAMVLTDPVDRSTGYAAAKQTVDVVTLSHEHKGHANLALVKPGYQVVRGPGEYEMHDIFITGIRTYHDEEKGKLRGYNTIYIIEVEGIRICHLGDLGHPLTEEHTQALSNVDVLLVPAGGGEVITPAAAAEVVTALEPKLVIPMQFKTEIGDKSLGPVDDFCKHLGVPVPEPEDKLALRASELTEVMRLVVLRPESEPARR